MFRMTSLAPVLLCCLATVALADTAGSSLHPASLSNHRKAVPKAVRHVEAPKVRPRTAVSTIESIVGGGGGRRGGAPGDAAHGIATGAAWSVSPEWNASNGGPSAAYGTRALVNELHANPGETTGYGAGAKLDFHF